MQCEFPLKSFILCALAGTFVTRVSRFEFLKMWDPKHPVSTMTMSFGRPSVLRTIRATLVTSLSSSLDFSLLFLLLGELIVTGSFDVEVESFNFVGLGVALACSFSDAIDLDLDILSVEAVESG